MDNGGSGKIIMLLAGLLGLLIIIPVILFLGAGDEETPEADPHGICLIEGLPLGDTESTQTVRIPEEYRDAVQKAADTAGLPIGIIAAQIQQESNWNPQAGSPKGAQGIAQFIPATWAEWGNGKDVLDPFAAIDAQGRYMKHLGDDVAKRATSENQKVKLTLAAYNAGPGAVDKYDGVPPFLETQEYVATIMGNAQTEFSTSCEAPGGFEFGDLAPDEWAHPFPNSTLTSPYGSRPCPLSSCAGMPFLMVHEGIDLGGSEPYFYAPTDMKITYVSVGAPDKLYGSYGNYIFGQMTQAPYLVFEFHEAADHSLLVNTGDVVEKGTALGKPGATGNSSGIHVHFQIDDPQDAVFDRPAINNGKSIDPIPVLRQQKVNIQ